MVHYGEFENFLKDTNFINSVISSASELMKLSQDTLHISPGDLLIQVNADLKKLLVASIGDDLHYKVDALVRTKVQLANEIGDYTRKLVEDYEDLDKITIQADLWHAKYQASRLLAEQLSSERDHVGYVCSQSQMALQNLLDEKKELHEQLLHLNRSLQSLHATFASSRAAAQLMQSDGHYLELVRNSNKLMDDICYTLMGSRPNRRPIPAQRIPLTPAEQVAFQALSSTPKNFTVNIGSNPSTNYVTGHIHSFPRYHPGARYEGFTLSSCKHCKGKLQVV